MQHFQKVGVIGAGSWGTALAILLHDRGCHVRVWGHNPETIAEIQATRINSRYLPGISLPATMEFTTELAQLRDSDLLLFVTPSKAIREVSQAASQIGLPSSVAFLSCTKGVERGTGLRMSEILRSQFPENPISVLSGPSHAEEVARRLPTAVVIGSEVPEIGARLQATFTTPYFRSYTNQDLIGVEMGGALKNIFALAAGVSDGLGLGDNAKAALITRSLAELIRLGMAMGGKRDTFQGLGGIGDLMVTCFSRHSRNRSFGERLGKGETRAEITASMQMVAEGIPTTYGACECAERLGVPTPIADQMRAVLDEKVSPRKALENLLTRVPKAED